MSSFKEMLDKTGVVVVGLVKSVNEYVSEKQKSYWSVDVEVKGTRLPVKINLPTGFDRSKFKEYELAKILCTLKPTFDHKGTVLEAIGVGQVQ